MKKKNPAISAVLNFFLPGLGFTYLGSPIFIVTGIAFFVCVLIGAIAVIQADLGVEAVAADIGAALAFAAISWEVTNLFNAAQPKSPTT